MTNGTAALLIEAQSVEIARLRRRIAELEAERDRWQESSDQNYRRALVGVRPPTPRRA
jgi:hypothetical protein